VKVVDRAKLRIEGGELHENMTQFLQYLLPGFKLMRLEHEDIDTEGHHITANVSSTQTLVQCPLCANPTTRIHSRYERTLLEPV
jgi:transposase